jgi:hypothetical protein
VKIAQAVWHALAVSLTCPQAESESNRHRESMRFRVDFVKAFRMKAAHVAPVQLALTPGKMMASAFGVSI